MTELKAIGEKRKMAYSGGFPKESDFLFGACNVFNCPDKGGQGIEQRNCKIPFESGVEFISDTGSNMVHGDIGFKV